MATKKRQIPGRKTLAVLVAACFAMPEAQANPVGPVVVNGQAAFSTQGAVLSVTNTPGAIINWQGFSIDASEATRFLQQSASSAILNRVLSSDPSVILGSLWSNGRVFLINPSGILVGQGARIDVAGLVASTLNISNQDFAAGKLFFQGNPLASSVVNDGQITTPSGGTVYLVAPNVVNNGLVNTPQGETILAAGNSVRIFDTGTPGVRVDIVADANKAENLGEIIANSGSVGLVGAIVRNKGRINADQLVRGADGKVWLRAKTELTLAPGSIISANGATGGEVALQAEQGVSLVSGTIEARGSEGLGGNISALGRYVGLTDKAALDASGTSGGGSILIGGDFQGRNSAVQNAERTYVGPEVVLRADATDNGHGGKVVVWADGATQFLGSIFARGGSNGGDGGNAEVSGKGYLDFRGQVDLRAPAGRVGNLLLDPQDIDIVNGADAGLNATADIDETSGTPSLFVSNSNVNATATLSNGTINRQLDSANVLVQTGGTGNGALGNITFQTGLNGSMSFTSTGNKSLSFDANGSIVLTGGNSTSFNLGSGGNLTLQARGGGISQTAGSDAVVSNQTATVLNATGAVALSNAGNNFTGNVGVIQATDVSLTSASALNVSAIAASGNIALSAQKVSILGDVVSSGVGNSITVTATNGTLTIQNSGTDVQTNAGNITFSGNAASSSGIGVSITAGNVSTNASGAISINGIGGNAIGVSLYGANVTSVDGDIALLGTGNGVNISAGVGVGLDAAALVRTTGSGNIGITGTSDVTGTAGIQNHGVWIVNGADVISSLGSITLTGTGSNGSSSLNSGVAVEGSGTTVTSVNGNITVMGTGRGTPGSSSSGVKIIASAFVGATGTGNVSITGISDATAGASNYGVWVSGNADVSAVEGTININGTGANTTSGSNLGVLLTGSGTTITGTNGSISVNGTNRGSGSGEHGVSVDNSVLVRSSGASNISITGISDASGSNSSNFGVQVTTGANVSATGSGAIAITGTGANNSGSNNYGVLLRGTTGTKIIAGAGGISIVGTGRGSSGSEFGVIADAGMQASTSGAGNINITGVSNATGVGSSQYGIWMSNSTNISATGTGGITLTGIGGNTSGGNNYGIWLAGSGTKIAAGDGGINISGSGGGSGSNSYGVMLDTASVTSSGAGDVGIAGIGVNGPGIYAVSTSPSISASTGDVVLNGTSTSTAGIDFSVATNVTTGGNLSLIANDMAINSGSNLSAAGGAVTFLPYDPASDINLGNASGGLALSNTELGAVKSSGMRFGSSNQTGNITFAQVSLSNKSVIAEQQSGGAGRIVLNDGGNFAVALATGSGAINLIAGSGGVNATTQSGSGGMPEISTNGTVTINTNGSVGANGYRIQFSGSNSPSSITIGNTAAPSAIYVAGGGLLAFGDVTTANGSFNVSASNGITLNGNVAVGNAAVSLDADSNVDGSGVLTLSTAKNITSTLADTHVVDSSGNITGSPAILLKGGDVVLNGTVNAATNSDVLLSPSLNGTPVGVGTGAGSFSVSNAEIGNINVTVGADGLGGALLIGSNTVNSGAITVANVTAGAKTIGLRSGSTIDDDGTTNAAIVTTSIVSLSSNGAIGASSGADGLTLDAGRLRIRNTGGNNATVTLTGGTNANTTVRGITTLSGSVGGGNVSITQAAGNLTLAGNFANDKIETNGSLAINVLGAGALLTVNSSMNVSAGNMALAADNMALNGLLTATGGTVGLAPSTPGRTIAVGNVSGSGGLEIDNSELANISTASVKFGGPLQTGDITFKGATVSGGKGIVAQNTGTGRIVLDDGGNVAVALSTGNGAINLIAGSGGINAAWPSSPGSTVEISTNSALTINTNGSVGANGYRVQISGNNTPSSITIGNTTAPSAVYMSSGGTLTFGDVTTANGSLNVVTNNGITLAGNVAVENATVTLDADFDANGTGVLTLAGGKTLSSTLINQHILDTNGNATGNAAIVLKGADMVLNGTVSAGTSSDVQLFPSMNGTTIGLGSGNGSFSVSSAEFGNIMLTLGGDGLGGNVQIGSSSVASGAITIANLNIGTKSIGIRSGATIDDDVTTVAALVTSGTVGLNSNGAIGGLSGADGLTLDVASLRVRSSGSNDVSLTFTGGTNSNTNLRRVTTLDGSVGGGNISVAKTLGNLTLAPLFSVDKIETSGSLAITVNGAGAQLIANNPSMNVSAGGITLLADNMTLGGNLTATGAGVSLAPFNTARAVAVGNVSGTGGLEIDNSELANISAVSVKFGSSLQTGGITFKGASTGKSVIAVNAGTGRIVLDDGGNVATALFTGNAPIDLTAGSGGINVTWPSVSGSTPEVNTNGTVTLNTNGSIGANGYRLQFGSSSQPSNITIGNSAAPSAIHMASGLNRSLAFGDVTTANGTINAVANTGITLNGNVSVGNSTIFLDADSDADGTGVLTLAAGKFIANTLVNQHITDATGNTIGNPAIALKGSDVVLNGNVAAGLNSDVFLGPSANGTTIGIGTGNGSFSVSNAEINSISVTAGADGLGGLLSIGCGTVPSGAMTVAGVSAGSKSIGLRSGSTIDDDGTTSSAAIVTSGGVSLGSSGVIGGSSGADGLTLDSGRLRISTTGGNDATITLTGGTNANVTLRRITTLGGTAGPGNVSITQSAGNLTLGGFFASDQIATNGSLVVNVQEAGAQLAMNSSMNMSAGNISLSADNMVLGGSIAGTGAVAALAKNGIAISGDVAAGGAIFIDADSDANGSGVLTLATGKSISSTLMNQHFIDASGDPTNGNAAIVLKGADAVLNGTVSAGTNSDVLIGPSMNGTTIGAGTGAGSFSLSDAEIDNVNVVTGNDSLGGMLVIGAGEISSGALTVANVTAGSKTIALISGASLDGDGAPGTALTTTGRLILESNGAIGAGGLTLDVANLHVRTTGGNSANLTLAGTTNPTTTIRRLTTLETSLGGGNVSVALNFGNLALAPTPGFTGDKIETSGSLTINVKGAGAQLTVSPGMNVSAGGITLAADSMSVNGLLKANGSTVSLAPYTTGRTIAVGNVSGSGGLEIDNSELANISAASVKFGGPLQTGDITFKGATVSGGKGIVAQNTGTGRIVLDDGGNVAVALATGNGAINLIAGSGGINAAWPSSQGSTGEISTNNTLTMNTLGSIGAGGYRVQISGNNSPSSITVGNTAAPSAVFLAGGGLLTFNGITTSNGTLNVVANNGITLNGNVAAGNGTISFDADNDSNGLGMFTLAAGKSLSSTRVNEHFTDTNGNSTGNAAISLKGADVVLNGTLTVGNNSDVILSPSMNGTTIGVGTGAGSFSVSDAEIDNISVVTGADGLGGVLSIGSNSVASGAMRIANVTAGGKSIALTSGSTLDDDATTGAAIVTSGIVSLRSNGTIGGASGADGLSLDPGRMRIRGTGGNNATVTFTGGTNANTTVRGITTLSGSVGSGNVSITQTAGNLTLGGFFAGDNIVTSGALAINVQGAGALLTLNASMNVSAGGITLVADNMAFGGLLTASGGTVSIAPAAAGRAIAVGNVSGTAGLEIDNSELGNISAASVKFGGPSQTGDITFKGATKTGGTGIVAHNTGTARIVLDDGGNVAVALATGNGAINLIAGSGGINASTPSGPAGTVEISTNGTLTINTVGTVGANGYRVQVSGNNTPSSITIGNTTAPSAVYMSSGGTLTFGDVTTANGSLNVVTNNGITLNGNVALGNATVALDADFDANGTGVLTLAGGKSLTSTRPNEHFTDASGATTGNAAIVLKGADMVLSGAITAGNNSDVFISPSMSGTTVGLGTGAGSFSLSDAEIDNINLIVGADGLGGSLAIGGSTVALGPITVAGVTAGSKSIGLRSGSTIDDDGTSSAAIVTTGIVSLNSNGAIGGLSGADGLTLDAGRFRIRSTGGNDAKVTFTGGSNANTTVRGITTLNGSVGGGNVSLTQAAGNLTLAANFASDRIETSGALAIDVQGAGAQLTVNPGMNLSAGSMVLAADNMALDGLLTVSGGTVSLAPYATGRTIAVGDVSGTGGLEIDNNEIGNISAASVKFGGASQTGDITFKGALIGRDVIARNTGAGRIVLDDGGNVAVALNTGNRAIDFAAGLGGISVTWPSVPGSLAEISTNGTVTLNTPGSIGSSTNRIQFSSLQSPSSITIGNTAAPNGVYLAGGDKLTFNGVSLAGPLNVGSLNGITVNGTINAGSGTIAFDADTNADGAGVFTLNSGAVITTTSGSHLADDVTGGSTSNPAAVSIRGADVVIAGSINLGANNGDVQIGPSKAGTTIGVGSGAGDFTVTQADLDNISTGITGTSSGGQIRIGQGSVATGAMQVGNLNAGANRLTFNSGSTIDDLGGSVAAVVMGAGGRLSLTSNGAIGGTSGSDGFTVNLPALRIQSTGGSDASVTDLGTADLTLRRATTGGAGTISLAKGAGNLSLTQYLPTYTGDVISTTGNVVLSVSGGSIVQGTNMTISAAGLATTSASGTTLNEANAVNSYGAANTGSGALQFNDNVVALSVTGLNQLGAGIASVSNIGAISTSGAMTSNAGGIVVFATGALTSSASVSAGGPVGLFGSGVTQSGAIAASGPITLDAGTGLLSVLAPVTATGAQVSLSAGDMNIGAALSNPAGSVVITNTSGGPVTVGGGLSGFGLSNDELNRINASSLTFNASPVTVDGAVNLTSVGSFLLRAGSLDVNNSFVVSGALDIDCTGDINVTASSAPVLLSAGAAYISGANFRLTGGSASGATASIVSTAGALTLETPATGTVKLISGTGAGAKSGVSSAGDLSVLTGTCELCSGNLQAAGKIFLAEAFPAVSAVEIATTEVIEDQQQALVSTVTTSIQAATVDKSEPASPTTTTLVAPSPSAAPTALVATTASAPKPNLTDPNGVVGGTESGSFGSTASSSTGSGTGSADSGTSGGTTGSSGASGSGSSESGSNGSSSSGSGSSSEQGDKKSEEEKKADDSAKAGTGKEDKPAAKPKPAMCS